MNGDGEEKIGGMGGTRDAMGHWRRAVGQWS